mmetsp:Transcript_5339/g.12409  ORF Transcript_5339/g.12409 Transcript_5339/m.12409 type:complete len:213 (+) Transcript_5339:695-1333(+)
MLPPVVVGVPISAEGEKVLDHELRDGKLPVANGPVEGGHDGAVHLHPGHPRHPVSSGRALNRLSEPLDVAVHEGHGDEVCANVEGPTHACAHAAPQVLPCGHNGGRPPGPRQLLEPAEDRLAEGLDVLPLDAVLDVPYRQALQRLKELLRHLCEHDEELYRLHPHVRLELLGPLEEVHHVRRLPPKLGEEGVSDLLARLDLLDLLPVCPTYL